MSIITLLNNLRNRSKNTGQISPDIILISNHLIDALLEDVAYFEGWIICQGTIALGTYCSGKGTLGTAGESGRRNPSKVCATYRQACSKRKTSRAEWSVPSYSPKFTRREITHLPRRREIQSTEAALIWLLPRMEGFSGIPRFQQETCPMINCMC